MDCIPRLEDDSHSFSQRDTPNLYEHHLAMPQVEDHIAQVSIILHDLAGEDAVGWFFWLVHEGEQPPSFLLLVFEEGKGDVLSDDLCEVLGST